MTLDQDTTQKLNLPQGPEGKYATVRRRRWTDNIGLLDYTCVYLRGVITIVRRKLGLKEN